MTTSIFCFGMSIGAAEDTGATLSFFAAETVGSGEEARTTEGEDFVKKEVMAFWPACFLGVRRGTGRS